MFIVIFCLYFSIILYDTIKLLLTLEGIMIVNRINEILDEQNKTIYWLAQQTGIRYNTIHSLVNNKTESVKFEILDKICDILECDISEIFRKI